ncbi:uncharacterized protein LOC141864658 [Acropora palmata]|uniref:uncharacterized protein LOC141864658 n=1 Tax=Acropora palmata TaxID=6131 RepID=UPI003DA06788
MKKKQVKACLLLSLTAALLMPHQQTEASVGTCSFHMYVYKTRVSCEIPFYKGLMLGMINNCSANFESFIGCIKEVTRVCEHSWRSDAWIDLDVRLKFQKRFYCENGALILPFAVCGKNYFERGPQCVQSFRKTFRDNITDSTTLCEEYSNAKRCIRKLLQEECSVPQKSRSLYMDVLFDGYNPFCKNSLYIYTPPTEATTPRRTNVERLVTTLPRKLGTNTAATKIVSTSCVCRSKLSWHLIFITLLAFSLALLI